MKESCTDRTIPLTGHILRLMIVTAAIIAYWKVQNHHFIRYKKSIEKDPHERILSICRRMDMPGVFLKACQENLSRAHYVRFGFEESEKTWVYKVYLEFADKSKEETGKRPGEKKPDPFLSIGREETSSPCISGWKGFPSPRRLSENRPFNIKPVLRVVGDY